MPLAGGGDGGGENRGGRNGGRASATVDGRPIVSIHDLQRRLVHFGGTRCGRARRHLQLERGPTPPLQLDTEIKTLSVPSRALEAACSTHTQQIERCSSRGTKLSALDLLLRPLAVLHPKLRFGDRRPKGRVDAQRWRRRGALLQRKKGVEIHTGTQTLARAGGGEGKGALFFLVSHAAPE